MNPQATFIRRLVLWLPNRSKFCQAFPDEGHWTHEDTFDERHPPKIVRNAERSEGRGHPPVGGRSRNMCRWVGLGLARARRATPAQGGLPAYSAGPPLNTFDDWLPKLSNALRRARVWHELTLRRSHLPAIVRPWVFTLREPILDIARRLQDIQVISQTPDSLYLAALVETLSPHLTDSIVLFRGGWSLTSTRSDQ